MKRGFTLIELLLALTLFGIVVSFLYGTLGELKLSNELLLKKDEQLVEREKFIEVLNRDIFEAQGFKVENRNSGNMVLHLQTKNSLYNSNFVYTKWFLNLENNILVRGESPEVFTLPVPNERLHFVRFDEVLRDVERFQVFDSKKKDGVIISIKDLNTSEIFAVEIMKLILPSVAGSDSNATEVNTTSESNETNGTQS